MLDFELNPKVKLAIGMPNTGTIKVQTVQALIRMLRTLTCEYDVILRQGSVLHQGRETIVKTAIELEATHLLFIDSDMYFEADAANRLLARDKDIVGTHANHRKLPPRTNVIMSEEAKSRLKEEHPDGFLTCDGVGTAFVLVKLDVFKKLSHPWFFWEVDDKGETIVGEDYWFCKKATAAGFKIWVDLSLKIGHIGDYIY